MTVYLNIIQIIVSIALIIIIMLQAKGGGMGSAFGGSAGIYRTKRGIEKTMFNATIGLTVLFFFISILSVILQ